MTETPREREIKLREIAQQNAGRIVEGSGRKIAPKAMPEMISVRLDPAVARALRRLAKKRGTTLSDLLREGAQLVLSQQTLGDQNKINLTFLKGVSAIPYRTSSSFPRIQTYVKAG